MKIDKNINPPEGFTLSYLASESKYSMNIRIQTTGECWMICNECGSRLGSFDGNADASRSCPYKQSGKCEP